MITNIASLMNLVSEEEKNLNMLNHQEQLHSYNITTK